MIKQDKVNLIKEWYEFRENMCNKYNNICPKCPLYESSGGWRGKNGEYEYVFNCKYDFEDSFAEEIIELMALK